MYVHAFVRACVHAGLCRQTNRQMHARTHTHREKERDRERAREQERERERERERIKSDPPDSRGHWYVAPATLFPEPACFTTG